MYRKNGAAKHIDRVEKTGGGVLYNFFLNKWYIDELYDLTVVRGARALGDLFWKIGDIGIIDRFGPNGVAGLAASVSGRLSRFQSGKVFHYAFVMLIGVMILIMVGLRGFGG